MAIIRWNPSLLVAVSGNLGTATLYKFPGKTVMKRRKAKTRKPPPAIAGESEAWMHIAQVWKLLEDYLKRTWVIYPKPEPCSGFGYFALINLGPEMYGRPWQMVPYNIRDVNYDLTATWDSSTKTLHFSLFPVTVPEGVQVTVYIVDDYEHWGNRYRYYFQYRRFGPGERMEGDFDHLYEYGYYWMEYIVRDLKTGETFESLNWRVATY